MALQEEGSLTLSEFWNLTANTFRERVRSGFGAGEFGRCTHCSPWLQSRSIKVGLKVAFVFADERGSFHVVDQVGRIVMIMMLYVADQRRYLAFAVQTGGRVG